ncbi:MAG: CAP domain-containing protein [Mycoplasmatales bacterium]
MSKKLIVISCISLFVVVILGLTVNFYAKMKTVEENLMNLGYTQEEASKIAIAQNMDSIYELESKKLNEQYNDLSKKLSTKPISAPMFGLTENQKLLDKIKILKKEVDTRTIQVKKLLKVLSDQNIAYKVDTNLILDKQIEAVNKKINETDSKKAQIKELIDFLNSNNIDFEEDKTKSLDEQIKTLTASKEEFEAEQKRKEEEASRAAAASAGTPANIAGGYNIDSASQAFLASINSYRASLGLQPYAYNNSMQWCATQEATAYSQNMNPHNWSCPMDNANASLSSTNSNYVQVAMNFFYSSPSHNAPLISNYNSIAVGAVERDGMVYMIVSFYY